MQEEGEKPINEENDVKQVTLAFQDTDRKVKRNKKAYKKKTANVKDEVKTKGHSSSNRKAVLSIVPAHCVDHIYRDTPSARIDLLMPTRKQLPDGRHHTAASREKEPLSHSRLHAAVSRGIECLSNTCQETAV